MGVLQMNFQQNGFVKRAERENEWRRRGGFQETAIYNCECCAVLCCAVYVRFQTFKQRCVREYSWKTILFVVHFSFYLFFSYGAWELCGSLFDALKLSFRQIVCVRSFVRSHVCVRVSVVQAQARSQAIGTFSVLNIVSHYNICYCSSFCSKLLHLIWNTSEQRQQWLLKVATEVNRNRAHTLAHINEMFPEKISG